MQTKKQGICKHEWFVLGTGYWVLGTGYWVLGTATAGCLQKTKPGTVCPSPADCVCVGCEGYCDCACDSSSSTPSPACTSSMANTIIPVAVVGVVPITTISPTARRGRS